MVLQQPEIFEVWIMDLKRRLRQCQSRQDIITIMRDGFVRRCVQDLPDALRHELQAYASERSRELSERAALQ